MLALALTLIAPAHAGRADRKAEKALQAYQDMDMQRAFKHCAKALKIEPMHVEASAVCGGVLMQVGTETQDMELITTGAALLDYVASVDPNHPVVVMWDSLIKMVSTPTLVPEPDVRCSPAAQGAWDKAEAAFGRGDMKTAKSYYEVAANGCEHPRLWTYYGDTFFHEQDWQGALAAYDHALQIEPCYWVARRFKGDALVQQGQVDEGIRWTASAIACNPTYEHAWAYLDAQMDPRVEAARSVRKPDFAGGSTMTVGGPMSGPWAMDIQLIYGVALSIPAPSRLDQERHAAGLTLSSLRERGSWEGLELWQLLDEADGRGQLDPALFVLLLDPYLAPEFLEYREDHLDELTEFVMDLMR